MTPVYLSDAQLGAWLLLSRLLYSLACDTVMVPHGEGVGTAVCDPVCCGWHWADVRVVAAEVRRFEVPEDNALEAVWVVSGTGQVPGVMHRANPLLRTSPDENPSKEDAASPTHLAMRSGAASGKSPLDLEGEVS